MSLQYPELPKNVWVRVCQECGNKQIERFRPVYGEEPSDRFCNRKCKKCKSEALDYGMENTEVSEDY